MAAMYRLGLWRRLLNALVRILLLVGLGPRHAYLLTVRVRGTVTWYSTLVILVEQGTNRWLVAPDGKVSWVRKARSGRGCAGRILQVPPGQMKKHGPPPWAGQGHGKHSKKPKDK